MIEKSKASIKPGDTRESYNFVGQLVDTLSVIVLGGKDAMQALLNMCRLTATSRIPDVVCSGGNTLGLPLI